MNNKGTILILVIIFVFIFSVLGLISMRIAVFHNANIFKDLTDKRKYYAAESALEQAAFRMGLFAAPITVPAGATNAAAVNALQPRYAPNSTQAVYFLNPATNAASSATITYANGMWYPLGTSSIGDGTGLTPAITTLVSVSTENANPIDGKIQLAKTNAGSGSGNSVVIDGMVIDFGTGVAPDTRLVSPLRNAAGIGIPYRMDIPKITIENNKITFNVNFSNTGILNAAGTAVATPTLFSDPHFETLATQWRYLNGASFPNTNSNVHIVPQLFRVFYEALMILQSNTNDDDPTEVIHYVIRSTASDGSSVPVNLEFHYSVAKWVTLSSNTFNDLMDRVSNNSYSPNQIDPVIFAHNSLGITVSNGQVTSVGGTPVTTNNVKFRNYFRSRR